MKMKNLFIVVFSLISTLLVAQTEIGLYGSALDYPGIYVGHNFNNSVEFNLSGSFRYETGNVQFADTPNTDIRTNTFITFAVYKNLNSNVTYGNWFAGGYLRYWGEGWRISSTENLTPEQAQFADEVALTTSRNSYKISIGAIGGYKFKIGNHFAITLTAGLGFSPKFAYWRAITEYNREPYTHPYGSNDFVGYFNHLSGIGRLSIGYRF
jgi:hypothetical protein